MNSNDLSVFGFGISFVVIAFILIVVIYLLNGIAAYKLAEAAEISGGGLAFVPIGTFNTKVFIDSISEMSGKEKGKTMMWTIFSLLPFLNFIGVIVMFFKSLSAMSAFCTAFGKSMFVYILMWLFIPVFGPFLVMSSMRKTYLLEIGAIVKK